MKITCSRRDDVLRDQAADKAFRDRKDSEWSNFSKAQQDVFSGLSRLISSEIGNTPLDLQIDVSQGYGSNINVRVSDENHLHDDNKSLSWKWEVSLDRDGNIKRDSSSWSGLKATTPEHLEDLRNILDVLTVLNNIDWNQMLNVKLPNVSDYVSEEVNPYAGRNFKQELLMADIEDAIGADVYLVGSGNKYYRPRATCGYKIISQSPTQYTVEEVLFQDGNPSVESIYGEGAPSYRIKKDNLIGLLKSPIQKVEV